MQHESITESFLKYYRAALSKHMFKNKGFVFFLLIYLRDFTVRHGDLFGAVFHQVVDSIPIGCERTILNP